MKNKLSFSELTPPRHRGLFARFFALFFCLVLGMNVWGQTFSWDDATYNSSTKSYDVTGFGSVFKGTSPGTVTINNGGSYACGGYTGNVKSGSSIIIIKPAIAISGIKMNANTDSGPRTLTSVSKSNAINGTYTDITGATITPSTGIAKNTCAEYTFTFDAASGDFIKITMSGNWYYSSIELIPAGSSCSATAPGDITKGAKGNPLTLTAAGSPAEHNTWYWQTAEDGTSTANSGATFNVTAAGTYYVRSYCSDVDGCWSTAKSITVTESDLVAPSLGSIKTVDGETITWDLTAITADMAATLTGWTQNTSSKYYGNPAAEAAPAPLFSANPDWLGGLEVGVTDRNADKLRIYYKTSTNGICFNGGAAYIKIPVVAGNVLKITSAQTILSDDVTFTNVNGEFTAVVPDGKDYIAIKRNSGATYVKKIVLAPAPTCTTPTIAWATEPAGGRVGDADVVAAVTANQAGAAITWVSSKPEVATIVDGTIHFVAPGKTTITAKYTGSGEYCDEEVSVSKEIEVKTAMTYHAVTPNVDETDYEMYGTYALISGTAPKPAYAEWIEGTAKGVSGSSYTAPTGWLEGGSGKAGYGYATMTNANTLSFYITNCVAVEVLQTAGGSSRSITLSVLKDGVEVDAVKSENNASIKALAYTGLTATDKYKVVVTTNSSSDSRFFQIRFAAPAATTYGVTYAKGEATCELTLPEGIEKKEGAKFTLANALECEGFEFTGWNDGTTTYAAGAEYTMGAAPVEFVAQWTALTAHAVTYALGDGATGTVPTEANHYKGATFTLAAQGDIEKALNNFGGWNDGTNTYAAGAEYTMPDNDVTLTAVWTPRPASSEKQLTRVKFSNNFDAFVKESDHSVTAYYMGETAPEVVADSWVVSEKATAAVVDNKIVVTAEDGTTQDYAITLTQVTPATAGEYTFDGTESWVKTGYTYSSTKGWPISKSLDEPTANKMRIAEGWNRVNFFVAACENLTLYTASGITNDRPIEVYRNGVQLTGEGIPTTAPKYNTTDPAKITIPGDIQNPSYITIVNKGNGDGGFGKAEIKEHIVSADATLKTLKYGETPIALVAEQFTYSVELPWNTTAVPALAAEVNDANATKVITDATAFTEKAATSTVVVTAEDGVTTKTYTVNFTLEEHYVAQIDETKYTTLEAAVAAAEGKTVKLLENIDLAATLVVENTVTLDLNGKKIFNTVDLWELTPGAWSLISVRGEGDLTITGNGTMDAKANDCYAVDVQDETAKLTIENGTFYGNIHAVYVYAGLATINGGKYDIYQKSTQYAGDPNAFLLNCYDANRANGTAKIVINNGIFVGFDPSNNKAEGAATDFCPQGYAGEDLGDGTFGVKRVYTFEAWVDEVDFTKAGEWTMFTCNSDGKIAQTTTKFAAEQTIENGDKVNAYNQKYFVVKFENEVKAIKFNTYANNGTLRTFKTLKVAENEEKAKAGTYTAIDVTDKVTREVSSETRGNTYTFTIENIHFEAGKYYYFELSNAMPLYDFFYTESEVVTPAVTTITEVKINGEALDATELAAFIDNKGMTLPKTDAAFDVRATDIVKDIYDDGFEKVLATNETYTTAALEGDNFVATLDINGVTYTVTAPKMADPVAKIGTAAFETLAEAVAAANDGDEIIMLADIDLTAQIEIADKAIALDLAGHRINYTGASLGSGVLLVHNGAGLTINDSSDPDAGQIVANAAYAAVALTKKNDDAANAAVLVVNGGTLTGKYYAVVGNGSRPNTEITINGGTLTAVEPGDAIGIYHPQCGTLTISGGTIVAETGIAIKAGVLTINGGTIHATGANSVPTEAFGNGVNVSGAAIQIESNNSYGVACNKEVELHITAGTITSDNAPAIYEYVANASTETHMTNSSISGGTINGAQPVYVSAGVEGFIAGGTFNQAVPAAACALGFEPKDNGDGTYGVKVAENVVPISEKTVWDWNGLATETIAMPAGNDYILLAAAEGLPVDFKATSLASKKGSTHYAFRSTTYQCWQGGAIKFETTVPGIVTYTVVNPSKGTTINFDLNGEHVYAITAPSGSASSKQTISQLVSAGEVVLALEEAGKDMRVYKIEFEPTTTIRNTTAGKLVTMCQAQSVAKLDGAIAYEVEKKNAIGIDLVEAEFPLIAGKPYILEATKAQINAVLVGEEAETVVAANGLVGNLSTATDNLPIADYSETNQNYVFQNNHLYKAKSNYAQADRAYLNYYLVQDETVQDNPDAAPRRRISMTTNETNATTGLEKFEATEDVQKIMLNGELYIIRGGKMFNANGQLLK